MMMIRYSSQSTDVPSVYFEIRSIKQNPDASLPATLSCEGVWAWRVPDPLRFSSVKVLTRLLPVLTGISPSFVSRKRQDLPAATLQSRRVLYERKEAEALRPQRRVCQVQLEGLCCCSESIVISLLIFPFCHSSKQTVPWVWWGGRSN